MFSSVQFRSCAANLLTVNLRASLTAGRKEEHSVQRGGLVQGAEPAGMARHPPPGPPHTRPGGRAARRPAAL